MSYEAFKNGKFTTGKAISTLMACPVDNDHKYTQLIKNANQFQLVNGGFKLLLDGK